MKQLHLTLDSRLDELDRLRDAAEVFLGSSFDPIETNRIILSLDEAFVNIIKHGFLGAAGNEIELLMEDDAQGFTFQLLDRAPLYNPLHAARPAPEGVGEMGQDHGLGVHLYTTIMNASHEAREGGGNCLILRKARRI